MDEQEARLREALEAAFSMSLEDIDVIELDDLTEMISPKAFVDFLLSEPRRYLLKNALIVTYLSDLLLPHTTESQWMLGRNFASQLINPLLIESNTMGRPVEAVDRIFLCVHIEWCMEALEMCEAEAFATTAERFSVSENKIYRWYMGGKGAVFKERSFARFIMGMFDPDCGFTSALKIDESALISRFREPK